MSELNKLLALPEDEKEAKGLVFTPREICRQPATWQTTYQDFLQLAPQVEAFLENAGVGVSLKQRPGVFLIGAGTSDYIGQALVHLLRRRWQCEVQAVASTDLLSNLDDLILRDKPYLWVSFSRSGDSPEGVAVIEAALNRYPEIRQLIITCHGQGRMARQFAGQPGVFCLVLDEATNDCGLAMTSSFSNMIVAGQCLAHFQDLEEYRGIVLSLRRLGERLLDPVADLAAQIAAEGYARVCFLGTGALKAAARESELKMLEMTAGKVWPRSDSYLGIRHGPLSALDAETLVVGFLSSDHRRQAYELDLLEEMRQKKLGKKRLVVAPESSSQIESVAHHVISFSSLGLPAAVPDEYRPPADVMVGQLLGLFFSLRHGLKPDHPSPGGVINRVVSRVRIHTDSVDA